MITAIVFVALVAQNSSHALLMRYSRGILKEDYILSTAVILMECIKLSFCVYMISTRWHEQVNK